MKNSEIFVKSSNIGTIKKFEQTSNKSFYNKMQDFGFGIKTNISSKKRIAFTCEFKTFLSTTNRKLCNSIFYKLFKTWF